MLRTFFSMFINALVLLTFVGCERNGVKVAPAEKSVVPVSHPEVREVTDYVDYTGRTNAKDSVVIQPRVTGYLVTDDKEGRMPFKEGDFVKKDAILFKIDPRPYQAQFDAANAAIVVARLAIRASGCFRCSYRLSGIMRLRSEAGSSI